MNVIKKKLQLFFKTIAWWQWCRRLLWAIVVFLGIGWATFVGLQWWILPRISQGQLYLQKWAQNYWGLDVAVEKIALKNTWTAAYFELTDVQVAPLGKKQAAIAVPYMQIKITPWSLLHLNADELTIKGLDIEIERDVQGIIRIAGIDVSSSPETPFLNALFSQSLLTIEQGRLRWKDALHPDAGMVMWDHMQMSVKHFFHQHQLVMKAYPSLHPNDIWTLSLNVRSPWWNRQYGNWKQWVGEVSIDLSYLDMARWQAFLDIQTGLGVEGLQGKGRLKSTLHIDASTIDYSEHEWQMKELAFKIKDMPAAMQFKSSSGQLVLDSSPKASLIELKNLRLEPLDQPVLKLEQLLWKKTQSATPIKQQLVLKQLSLQEWIPWLTKGWGNEPWLAQASKWGAQGHIEELDLSWEGKMPNLYGIWSMEGTLNDVGWQAGVLPVKLSAYDVARPGVQKLQLKISGNQKKGTLSLNTQNAMWILPGIFDDPRLPITLLKGELDWQRVDEKQYELKTDRLDWSNADFSWNIKAKWLPRSLDGGFVDLDMSSPEVNLSKLGRYLPRVAGHEAFQYLSSAIVAGKGLNTHIQIQGPVNKIPFEKNAKEGQFKIQSQLKEVRWITVPDYLNEGRWPGLQNLSGSFEMDRQKIVIRDIEAEMGQQAAFKVTKAQASMEDVLSHEPKVNLYMQAQGPFQAALTTVKQTQLHGLLGNLFEEAQASQGKTSLDLQLQIPLIAPRDSKVKGRLTWKDVGLQWNAQMPLIADAEGQLDFTESSMQSQYMKGSVAGDVAQAYLSWPSLEAPIDFRLQGKAQAQALKAWLSPSSSLASHMGGQLAYQLTAKKEKNKGRQWKAVIDFKDWEFRAPLPLAKSRNQAATLYIEGQPMASSLNREQIEWKWVDDRQQIKWQGKYREPLKQGQAGQAIWAFGTALNGHWPTQGGRGQVAIERMNAQEWTSWLSQSTGVTKDKLLAAFPKGWVDRVEFNVARLEAEGWGFEALKAQALFDAKGIKAQVYSPQIKGRLDYQWPAHSQAQGYLQARLDELTINPLPPLRAMTLTPPYVEEKVEPKSLPGVDVQVKQLTIKGKNYGALQLEGFNRIVERVNGFPASEWRFNRLWLDTPEAQLRAEGRWGSELNSAATLDQINQRSTSIDLDLTIKDSGALLERLGMDDVMRLAPGRIKGSLNWKGSPITWDKASLSGHLDIKLEQGQFLKADPGIAKLLGILSLQALPRRFLFDFKDIVNEGYRFDHIQGKAQMNQGLLNTSDLTIKGLQATILVEGQADIVKETQDIKMLVIPQLEANTLSLVAAASNPVVGLVSFVTQRMISGVVGSTASKTLHVTGSWQEPQVEEIKISPSPTTPPTPSISGPSSAASIGARP